MGPGLKASGPLEPLGFLQLEAGARLADSGGGPGGGLYPGCTCVTLRDKTERPETLEVGSNLLAGADSLRMAVKVRLMMEQGNGWKNPFGDGRAGEGILEHLTSD
ncbi:MAG: UDP-N-acetylglucosamine 2-epimerase [Methanosaeta sp. PtaB.Bin018]|nr:MAG: UDP-N-acetylglucosamine 2-epimerase [Methanosaeta sp. PtaB.Bin018]